MNSGYLWFSGRWPFGRSAGYFLAPMAQGLGLDKTKNAEIAKNDFLGTFIKNHSGFVKSNVEGAIASFCLVFRAFLQIILISVISIPRLRIY